MGGNAFDKEHPAARLTSDQLLLLSALMQSRLTGCFIKTQHLLFLDSKTSHGDLDLLCAWDAPDWATNGKAPEEEKEAFAEKLAKKVGAERWKTSGSRVGSLEVHLAVPVGCLDPGLRFSEVSCHTRHGVNERADHFRHTIKSTSSSAYRNISTSASSSAPMV